MAPPAQAPPPGADDPPAPWSTGGAAGGELRGYGVASLVLGLCTGLAWIFDLAGLAEANLVLSYLLGVAAVAAWHGRGPAIFFSCAAVLAFNFFFTEPHFTLLVHDSQYLFTFFVMLTIGVLVSTLTARLREQSRAALIGQQRSELLYRVTRVLSGASGRDEIARAAERLVAEAVGLEVVVLVGDERGQLDLAPAPAWLRDSPPLRELARRAGEGGRPAAAAEALALPLSVPERVLGALVARSGRPERLTQEEPRRILETVAGQVAQALQRERLAEGVHQATAQAEAEMLKNALLSSVSHDLRTPLACIAGASSSLLEAGAELDPEERQDLLRTIFSEADWLSRFVDNLLQMTRFAAGGVQARREWHVLEDLVGSALTRLAGQLGRHRLRTEVGPELPLVSVDGVLIEHVLLNLLENATRYTPPGSDIEVSARVQGDALVVAVADRGPGVAAAEKELVFEKFYRGEQSRAARGAGLGLTICRAVVLLHGGRMWVEDRSGGGARFCFSLPLDEQPPALVEDPAPVEGEAT